VSNLGLVKDFYFPEFISSVLNIESNNKVLDCPMEFLIETFCGLLDISNHLGALEWDSLAINQTNLIELVIQSINYW